VLLCACYCISWHGDVGHLRLLPDSTDGYPSGSWAPDFIVTSRNINISLLYRNGDSFLHQA